MCGLPSVAMAADSSTHEKRKTIGNIEDIPSDLIAPKIVEGDPAAGKRVGKGMERE